ncbi:hypothetical protein K7X08_035205 [Anisodus acutangulus]|uniref:Protein DETOXIFICATION n=1 Tax=Anisodus acutangulus TaxID=402998 RepID=A0A9Q1R1L7_9SOLA|nr:hypothetical protein K7X08_035205 [Anisodus acutangulus]
MESPLLNNLSGDHRQLIGQDGDYRSIRSMNMKELWAVLWIETVKLWEIGGPIAFNIICQYGLYAITVAFCGHLGAVELSAVSVAQTVIGTLSFGFMLGMGSALETLCGQAFGAGQIHMLGGTFLLLPIYIFATPVLKLLGQEHEIAVLAGKFALLSIPELYSLEITSKVDVLACIGFLALLLHALLLWLFIYVFKMGTNGAALAFNITGWADAIVQFVYVVVWCKDGWTGWSLLALNEIWAFVRLSVASAVMLCLEMWYMMSIIILIGQLKDAVTAVGSLSICMNVDGWEEISWTRASQGYQIYCVYITVFQSLIGILCMILVLTVRNHLAILFTNSVAIGGGWLGLVAYINLGSYYVFGIPLGYILGFVANLGVVGLWGGMIAGLALQTVLLPFVLYRTDWNKEVEQSAERLRKWGGQDFEAEETLISEPA